MTAPLLRSRLRPEEIAGVLCDAGLLLQSDPAAPSVVGMLADGPVSGSWWGRPDGKAIYRGLEVLEDDPDIALFKLLGGKVTFVHRRLWPALAAVGLSRAPWQMDGLTDGERGALRLVDDEGELAARCLPGAEGGAAARIASRLEGRLLVCSRQAHTAQGSHAKILTGWKRWLELNGAAALGSLEAAKQQIEQAAVAVYAETPKAGALPWIAA